MTVVELLKAARAKIATPETWTQSAAARNCEGKPVPALDPTATCWCSIGALFSIEDMGTTLRYLECVMGRNAVAYFNDTHTHAEVMAAWDEAIRLAETEA